MRQCEFFLHFQEKEAEESIEHSTYEHINKADDHFDAQMVDAGTQEQAKEAPAPADTQEKEMADQEMLDTPMEVTLSPIANLYNDHCLNFISRISRVRHEGENPGGGIKNIKMRY